MKIAHFLTWKKFGKHNTQQAIIQDQKRHLALMEPHSAFSSQMSGQGFFSVETVDYTISMIFFLFKFLKDCLSEITNSKYCAQSIEVINTEVVRKWCLVMSFGKILWKHIFWQKKLPKWMHECIIWMVLNMINTYKLIRIVAFQFVEWCHSSM